MTADASTFRDLLAARLPVEALPAAHIAKAVEYLAVAEAEMAAIPPLPDRPAAIRAPWVPVSPPHALAFAQAHLKLAELKMLDRQRRQAAINSLKPGPGER